MPNDNDQHDAKAAMISGWRKQIGMANQAALAPKRRGPKPDASARQIQELRRIGVVARCHGERIYHLAGILGMLLGAVKPTNTVRGHAVGSVATRELLHEPRPGVGVPVHIAPGWGVPAPRQICDSFDRR